jgi:hypothetical protein
MTTENPPPDKPADPTDSLQFDKASFDQPAAATATCAVCRQPIAGWYFSINEQIVCPACREGILASMTGGSGVKRFARATAFGVGAGIAGALIWWGISEATDASWGIVAVLVGFMVGAAVRAGARHRGGIAYQLLAVALTYFAISASFLPQAYKESRGTPSAATQPSAAEPVTAVHRTVFLVVVFIAGPIFVGLKSIIFLLILAFALWEAWKINKKVALNFTGPFSLNAPPPPPLPSTPGQPS